MVHTATANTVRFAVTLLPMGGRGDDVGYAICSWSTQVTSRRRLNLRGVEDPLSRSAQIEHSSEAILATRPRPRALLRVSPLLLLLLVFPPSAPSPAAPALLSSICRLRGGYGMMDEDACAASAFGSVPMRAGKMPPSVPVVNSYLRTGRIKVRGLAPPPRSSRHMLSSSSPLPPSSLLPRSLLRARNSLVRKQAWSPHYYLVPYHLRIPPPTPLPP